MALTPKMVKFVNEYLIDLNGTQAAIRAGYSEDSAGAIASENLTKPEILAYLEQRRQEISAACQISPEWVINRLKEISDRSMTAIPVLENVDGEWVESGEYKYDSMGANKATELIGKHLGLFTNKLDITTKGDKLENKQAFILLPGGEKLEI